MLTKKKGRWGEKVYIFEKYVSSMKWKFKILSFFSSSVALQVVKSVCVTT